MANKYALALSDVQEFKSWLMQNGWCIEKIKGENEIVRMTSDKHEKPLVIYKQTKESIFASVPDMWYDVINAFYAERKAKEAAGCSAEAKEKLLKLIDALSNSLCNECHIGGGVCPCKSCRWNSESLENEIADIVDL